MFDSTVPQNIPTTAKRVAVYFNGRFAADPKEVAARFPNARIYWIDVLGTNPQECSILDIETGNATPNTVKSWAPARANKGLIRLYSNESTWPAVRAAVVTLSSDVRAKVRYWIANPTNPPFYHIVPGSDATQYAWDGIYDRSAVLDSWDN